MTTLEKQIRSLNLRRKGPGERKGRATVLYDPREAADIDTETIHAVATEGLEELVRRDAAFGPYGGTLLSEAALGCHREELTRELNGRLDASLQGLLQLLAPHFLLPAAQQVLEFLIRHFRVNELNQDALMACALPYHATPAFVRLARTLRLTGTLWEWLRPVVDTGAAPQRDLLVQRCAKDRALLAYLCRTAEAAAARGPCGRPFVTLWAAVVTELLAAEAAVKEDLVLALLPCVKAGLSGRAGADLACAALMAAAQLARTAALAPALLTDLELSVARMATGGGGLHDEAVTLLVILSATQAMPPLAGPTLDVLVEDERLLPALAALAAQHHNVAGLVHRLAAGLAAGAALALAPGRACLAGLVQRLPLPAATAEAVAAAVLQQGAGASDEEGAKGELRGILRALDLKYPEQTDRAVNAVLQQLRRAEAAQAAGLEPGAPPAPATPPVTPTPSNLEGSGGLLGHLQLVAGEQGRGGGDGQSGGRATPRSALEVMAFLQEVTTRQPCSAVSLGGTLSTLQGALVGPAPELRKQALEELGRQLEGAGAPLEGGDLDRLAPAVLRCLADSDPQVAGAALGSPLLGAAPAGDVFEAVAGIVARGRAGKKGVRRLAAKGLAYLAGGFLELHSGYADRVAGLLLDSLWPLPQGHCTLLRAALAAAEHLQHPLLTGLGPVTVDREGGVPGEPQATKAEQLGRQLHALVAALAARCASDSAAREALGPLHAAAGAPGRLLLQLALLVCLAGTEADAAAKEHATKQALALLGSDWGALEGEVSAPGDPGLLSSTSGQEDPTAAVAFVQLAQHSSQPSPSLGVLVGRALLLRALDLLSRSSDGSDDCAAAFKALLGLRPREAFEAPLALLMRQGAGQGASPALMVVEALGGTPSGAHAEEEVRAQVAALQLLAWLSHGTLPPAPLWLRVVPRLLAALASPARAVRSAALGTLRAVAPVAAAAHRKQETPAGLSHTPRRAFQRLAEALAAEGPYLEESEGALAVLLQSTLAAGAAPGQQAPRGVAMSPEDARALATFFLEALPHQTGPAGAPAAALLARVVSVAPSPGGAVSPAQRLAAAWQLLRKLRGASGLTQAEAAVGAQALQWCSPQALAAADDKAAAAAEAVTELCAFLEEATPAAGARAATRGPEVGPGTSLRAAALRQCTPALAAALDAAQQTRLLLALLRALRQSSHPDERSAAHSALAAFPLSANALQLLLVTTPQGPGATVEGPMLEEQQPSKRRRSKGTPSKAGKAASGSSSASSLAATAEWRQAARVAPGDALSLLELLQGREGLEREGGLVRPLLALLAELLAARGGDGATAAVMEAAAEADGPAGRSLSLLADDLTELTLGALRRVCGAAPAPDAPRLLGAALRAARGGRQHSSRAVRRAALGLLADVAAARPRQQLADLEQALALAASSTADDEEPGGTAAELLGAVLSTLGPCWEQGGHPLGALATAAVAQAARLSAGARGGVLTALLQSLHRQEEGLGALLVELLQGDAAGASWRGEAAQDLCLQARPAALWQDMRALPSMLEEQPVPLDAALRALGAALAVIPAAAAELAAQVLAGAEQDGDVPAQVRAAGTALLQATTAQVQAANGQSAEGGEARGGPALPLLALLPALGALLGSGPHLAALVQLSSGSANGSAAAPATQRRALRALAGAWEALPPRAKAPRSLGRGRARRAEREDAAQEAAQREQGIPEALEGLCGVVARLLGSADASPATREAALAALSAAAQARGAHYHEPLLAALPAVAAVASEERSRTAALLCLAAMLGALGERALPALPTLLPAVLGGLEHATAALPSPPAAGAPAGAAEAAPTGAAETVEVAGELDRPAAEEAGAQGTAAEEQQEPRGSRRRRRGRGAKGTSGAEGEAPALEAAAATAAATALVDHLGPYLAPSLAPLLTALLRPKLLACREFGVSEGAAGARAALTRAVPPRLLLPALFGQLGACLQEGPSVTLGLLSAVGQALDPLGAAAVAAHREPAFTFLLAALDTRRSHALATAGGEGLRGWQLADVAAVEAAVVRLLVALVLKLSEAQFRPLFLRLLDWATAAAGPGAGGGEAALARPLALFGAVLALTEALRSVFTPYFSYLLEVALDYLGEGAAAEELGPDGQPARKKKRKQQQRRKAEEAESLSLWLLRLKVLRALRDCCRHDRGGEFLDEARAARLRPPLVAALALEAPPAAAAAALQQDPDALVALAPEAVPVMEAAAAAAAAGGTGAAAPEGPDLWGRAAVAALCALSAAGSEALRKDLNHDVLLRTRAASPLVRGRALAAASGAAQALGHEFLGLIPESLPFLAELLEDPEPALAGATQRLILRLEALSGESLQEYVRG